MSNTYNIELWKRLSHALRHGAVELGLNIASDGYVSIRELMRTRNFKGSALADIVSVVDNCPKRRFEIKEDQNGTKFIRATQGHMGL
jgi:RNA:NAD 2'-phosphotransferase (TPT1/KptA family)